MENIPEEFELKYLRKNLMCKLLLSFSQASFCPVSIFSVDYGYTIKLLLTNLFGPCGKYLDRSFEVRTERSEVRTKNCGPNIFPCGPNNWSIRAWYYTTCDSEGQYQDKRQVASVQMECTYFVHFGKNEHNCFEKAAELTTATKGGLNRFGNFLP